MREKILKYGKILLILLMSFMVGSMIAFATAAFQVKELRPAALKSYSAAFATFNSAKQALCEAENTLRLATLLDIQKGAYKANTEEIQRLQNLITNNSCNF